MRTIIEGPFVEVGVGEESTQSGLIQVTQGSRFPRDTGSDSQRHFWDRDPNLTSGS